MFIDFSPQNLAIIYFLHRCFSPAIAAERFRI